jgi:hypothetical protein
MGSCQMCTAVFFPRDKAGRAWRWPHTSSSAEVKNAWSYTYNALCVFMTWCLIKRWKFLKFLWDDKIWDGIIDTVTGLWSGRQRNYASSPSTGERYLLFSSPGRAGRLCGSHSFLLNGYFFPDSMGVQPLLWQRATPIIVGRFAGRTWKNNNKWYT